jgi:hypothetical protein
VVSTEDHNVFRLVALNEITVLMDGIRSARIPVVVIRALEWLKHPHHPLAAREPPPFSRADMLSQTVGLVLGEDPHDRDPGVHGIAEGEVNDPEITTEGNRRFGATLAENTQTLPLASGQEHGDHLSHGIASGWND